MPPADGASDARTRYLTLTFDDGFRASPLRAVVLFARFGGTGGRRR